MAASTEPGAGWMIWPKAARFLTMPVAETRCIICSAEMTAWCSAQASSGRDVTSVMALPQEKALDLKFLRSRTWLARDFADAENARSWLRSGASGLPENGAGFRSDWGGLLCVV